MAFHRPDGRVVCASSPAKRPQRVAARRRFPGGWIDHRYRTFSGDELLHNAPAADAAWEVLDAYAEKIDSANWQPGLANGAIPIANLRAALIEAGIVRPASGTRRRLPSRRVKLTPGDPIETLVALQRQ